MAVLDLVYSAREIAGIPERIASRMGSASDTNTAEYRAVSYATKTYSLINPRKLSMSFFPTGEFEYDLTVLISGYKKNTHKIEEVVFPGNDASVADSFPAWVYDQNKLDPCDWTTYLNPLNSMKPYLRFLNGSEPSASSSLKVYLIYTSPHLVDASNDTITDEEENDAEAFSHLIASKLLFIAANYYAGLDDASLDIQAIDTGNKSNTFNQRSKDAYKIFEEHMKSKTSHTGRIDWDSMSPEGDDRFWNDRRLR